MELKSVIEMTDLHKGDQLLVRKGNAIEYYKVQEVKVSRHGTEIILDKKKNTYFNLGMYLLRESTVDEVCIIAL